MNNAMTISAPRSMSAKSSKGEDDNRGECNCVSVDFTENGFSTRACFDPDKVDAKMDRYAQMPPDEKLTFGSGSVPTKQEADNVLSYIKGLLYAHCGEEMGDDKKKPAKKKDEEA